MSVDQSTSYFEKRMTELGITAHFNQVMLWRNGTDGKNELQPVPVFKEHPKGIEIIPYTLDRSTIRIEKEGSRIKKDWSIVRYEKPIVKDNGDTIKYLMPKGKGSFPLITPGILEAFDKKEQIPILILTEGYFKAWKGYMHGLPMIGLPSITHMREKEKGSLHSDILRIITCCDVKRVVWLTDGDCMDITGKEITDKKDLYTRPANFFFSISMFKQLLDDLSSTINIDKYFFYVNTEAILKEKNFMRPADECISRDKAKGLDDIMISFPDEIDSIKEDLLSVSKNGLWFERFNITSGIGRVRDHFRLNDVTRFYEFHCERRPDLKDKEFKFHGTVYKYNEETNVCEIKIPAASNLYCRVGNDYYKHVPRPNKYGQIETILRGRLKSTITDDHGKDFPKHIPKYEDFCNVPNHVNFQRVINNCYNLYNPIEHTPDEDPCTMEDCANIISYIQHVFGTKTARYKHPKTGERLEYPMWQLALDYLQILYHHPIEKLPILCLVSKQNKTGKTTFAKLLRVIFGANVAIVGNQDIAGDFNSHWSSKLVVICDETKIDKQHVVEKVKSLSTADKITMNAKGKDHVELDCFIKFIFITNNEETFIYMNEEDMRYWVIKVPVLKEENPNLIEALLEEVPAFLSFLNNRKISAERLTRMWFHESLLRTDALERVIASSHSTVKKELTTIIKNMFLDFGVDEIKMSCSDIRENFFRNKELNYIERVLKDEMNMHPEQQFRYKEKNKLFDTIEDAIDFVKKDMNIEHDLEAERYIKREGKGQRYTYPKWIDKTGEFGKPPERVPVTVKTIGRPYTFNRRDFIGENEDAEVPADIRDALAAPDKPLFNGHQSVPMGTGQKDQPIDDLPF